MEVQQIIADVRNSTSPMDSASKAKSKEKLITILSAIDSRNIPQDKKLKFEVGLAKLFHGFDFANTSAWTLSARILSLAVITERDLDLVVEGYYINSGALVGIIFGCIVAIPFVLSSNFLLIGATQFICILSGVIIGSAAERTALKKGRLVMLKAE